MDGKKYGGRVVDGQKNEGAKKKRSSKAIYIVTYALKVSVNGVKGQKKATASCHTPNRVYTK